jgi:hypothetical protein
MPVAKKYRALVDAAREIEEMKAPSVPDILRKRGFGYEARRVQALIDAVAVLERPAKRPKYLNE